jgi:hypothetical protein
VIVGAGFPVAVMLSVVAVPSEKLSVPGLTKAGGCFVDIETVIGLPFASCIGIDVEV